jgi:hypothetical protein
MTATNDVAMTRRGVLASAGAGASAVALGSAPIRRNCAMPFTSSHASSFGEKPGEEILQ